MKNKKILHDNYTPIYRGHQVVISFNYEIMIPEDDPVVLLCEEMERLDYTPLYHAYSKDGRKPAVSPNTISIILYTSDLIAPVMNKSSITP